jgi:dipeptidase D
MRRVESKATAVWRIFEGIAQVPRPSGGEQAVGEWIAGLAKQKGLASRFDEAGNLLVEVPATAGRQDRPGVILQGHLDMVCQKRPESGHDFAKDPIRLIERDGWVYGDGTTLGADNGIGVALALAAATEPGVAHPKLELLFTVDEETGLTGAMALRQDFLRGRLLLNLDSEDDSFTVGCAGGEQTQIELAIEMNTTAGWRAYQLTVGGLRGGHSGVNIHEQRANALKLLGRCLVQLAKTGEIRIGGIAGGSAHNAIPRDAEARVWLPSERTDASEILAKLEGLFRDEFAGIEPAIRVELTEAEGSGTTALTAASTRAVVDLLLAMPDGVHRFSRQFEGIVETSSNLAVAGTETEQVVLVSSQRSLKESCLDAMTAAVTAVAHLAGATTRTLGRYPGWDPDPNSALLAECVRAYEGLRGRRPAIRVIHAGLECGIIGKTYPGMDMASLGPNIENAHSPQERIEIVSVDACWELLKTLLGRL